MGKVPLAPGFHSASLAIIHQKALPFKLQFKLRE
jgi:hypothetical protein